VRVDFQQKISNIYEKGQYMTKAAIEHLQSPAGSWYQNQRHLMTLYTAIRHYFKIHASFGANCENLNLQHRAVSLRLHGFLVFVVYSIPNMVLK